VYRKPHPALISVLAGEIPCSCDRIPCWPASGNRVVGSNLSLSTNSRSQLVDFIGIPLEQIEAILHSVPHLVSIGIGTPKTIFLSRKIHCFAL
jgi:hypothetical protein